MLGPTSVTAELLTPVVPAAASASMALMESSNDTLGTVSPGRPWERVFTSVWLSLNSRAMRETAAVASYPLPARSNAARLGFGEVHR
jgi:ABC-type phosphate transport system permease subunit